MKASQYHLSTFYNEIILGLRQRTGLKGDFLANIVIYNLADKLHCEDDKVNSRLISKKIPHI